MKVKQFIHANQFHLYGEGRHILQSYDSKVVEISGAYPTLKIVLGRDWDYSTTTSKHIYEFLEEYGNINFYRVSNKRKYVNDLIEDGIIKYDKDMH